ncbi:MAG: ABC transporter permease subunit [Nitrososphaerales archaeon]
MAAEFTIIGITIDLIYSWIRMLIALALSIVFSLAIGILAARNKKAESIIIPVLDVFQSIPILGFFPLVIFGVIFVFPGQIGVNIAVILLVFTSMSWNIAFGVYEAVRSIPQDYIDLSEIAHTSSWERITSIYIPASLSRIAYNTQTSWAVGLFYLVSSEILTLGNTNVTATYGIGVRIYDFYLQGNFTAYIYSIIALLIAVVIWQFVFLREFALWSEKYKFVEEPRGVKRDPLLKFYSWVNHKSISKLFLMTHGRGVSRFTSSLSRFRKGLKYSILILVVIFLGFEIGAFVLTGKSFNNLPSLSVIGSKELSVITALAYSFVRVWYVYAICVLIAVPLGVVIALHMKLYNGLSPVLEVVASVPGPVLLPLFVEYLTSNGEAIAALVIFLGMFWYIIFNVMAGIRTLPAELFELRREFQVTNFQAWRGIYLPSIAGAFVTGSITAIGAAWNTLIIAEYFNPQIGSNSKLLTQVGIGIGKTISVATNTGDLLTLTLAVLSMTVLIVAFNLIVWRRVYHYVTRRYAYNR